MDYSYDLEERDVRVHGCIEKKTHLSQKESVLKRPLLAT